MKQKTLVSEKVRIEIPGAIDDNFLRRVKRINALLRLRVIQAAIQQKGKQVANNS